MYDLAQPQDVIKQMRDGEMSDEAIIKVCRQVIAELDKDTISLGWAVDDVKRIAPDLTVDQCREVLQAVEHNQDAEQGVTWDTLEYYANLVRSEA